MADTRRRSTPGSLRDRLERYLDAFITRVPPSSFAEALRAVLTAVDYDDPALIKSALAEARERLTDLVAESIETCLSLPAQAEALCTEELGDVEGEAFAPGRESDELANAFEDYFGKILAVLTDLRDGVVRELEAHGVAVPNSDRLQDAIKQVEALREHVLGGWPRTGAPLPPTDREMVRRSREEVDRDEHEPIEDAIRRLGGKVG